MNWMMGARESVRKREREILKGRANGKRTHFLFAAPSSFVHIV